MTVAETGSDPGAGSVDWLGVVGRVLDGDRAAYARLVRLVTGNLTAWRAYDFRADWDDMVQEVLVSTIEAYRANIARRAAIRQRAASVLSRYDAFVTLAACGAAPLGLSYTGDPAMTVTGWLKSLSGAFHGETLGALSVTDVALFRDANFVSCLVVTFVTQTW